MNYNRDDTNSKASDILGLMRFGPWSQFCLAHLFTNRDFPTGLLGLANIASPVDGQTGGICSRGEPVSVQRERLEWRLLLQNFRIPAFSLHGLSSITLASVHTETIGSK